MRGKHPSLGFGDKVGIPQLLGMAIFGILQGFSDGSPMAFCDGC
jgi:hypothetical protein